MDNITTRWGETLPITWENDEEGAETATITITEKETGTLVFTKTVDFVGLVADLTLTADETQMEVGKYDYMITLDYTDGTVEKYPDVNQCSDCDLPTFEVCVANDMNGS